MKVMERKHFMNWKYRIIMRSIPRLFGQEAHMRRKLRSMPAFLEISLPCTEYPSLLRIRCQSSEYT
ncbi:unnamed protein product [Leptidea sinapis]|uniref:Uncharacterized protein n=1 Tax=Leptidea sinapis TaxID=189913 RepID=A0A5E4Q1T9_9NEOP|nr:unnamed protein product [Leptidea sinapis]